MALLCEYTELQYDRNILTEAMESNKPLVLKNVVLQRVKTEYKNDNSTLPHQKIGKTISEINKQLK